MLGINFRCPYVTTLAILCFAVAGGAKFDSYLGTIKRKVMKHFDLVSVVSCHVRVPFTLSALGNFGHAATRSDNLILLGLTCL